MTPIGVVHNERTEPVDDDWDRVNSSIELDLSQLGEDAIKGLHRFSHVEVVFVFDRVDPDDVELSARHPRGNTAWPTVGILAQHAEARPNRIGTTVCELMAVRPGGVIEVRGWTRSTARPCSTSSRTSPSSHPAATFVSPTGPTS